jgi:very-short-patch-repair endonuclease
MTRYFNKTTEKQKRRQLRSNMTQAETMVWSKLRGKQMCNHKFRRQYSVGSYVIDFYCPALKLAVEIDGDSHFEEGIEAYDQQRQTFIENFGIRFLRFANREVYENLDGVSDAIRQAVRQLI